MIPTLESRSQALPFCAPFNGMHAVHAVGYNTRNAAKQVKHASLQLCDWCALSCLSHLHSIRISKSSQKLTRLRNHLAVRQSTDRRLFKQPLKSAQVLNVMQAFRAACLASAVAGLKLAEEVRTGCVCVQLLKCCISGHLVCDLGMQELPCLLLLLLPFHGGLRLQLSLQCYAHTCKGSARKLLLLHSAHKIWHICLWSPTLCASTPRQTATLVCLFRAACISQDMGPAIWGLCATSMIKLPPNSAFG